MAVKKEALHLLGETQQAATKGLSWTAAVSLPFSTDVSIGQLKQNSSFHILSLGESFPPLFVQHGDPVYLPWKPSILQKIVGNVLKGILK